MRGFTLVELLVVIAVLGLLLTGTYVSFRSYNQSQSMQTSVADVQQALNTAKSRSLSQVKPSACGTDVLEGYQVSITQPSTFRLEVVCGGTVYMLETKKLATSITFASNTATSVRFSIATAAVQTPGNFVLTGANQTKTIKTDAVGKISVQ